MKEYQITVQRTYNTTITLKFPDDGRDHEANININMLTDDNDIWDYVYEKELEQMDVTDVNWEIKETKSTESHWEFDKNGNNIIK